MLFKKLGRFIIILTGMLSFSVYAMPILSIVPSTKNITLRSDSMTPVLYTVTNNSNQPVYSLTIDPAFGSSGNQAQVLLLTNQCQGVLMPRGSCQFRILIKGRTVPEILGVSPRVCIFNNAVCSQPTLENRINVSFLAADLTFAYFGVRTYGGSGTNYSNKLVRINSSTLRIDTDGAIDIHFGLDGFAAGIAVDSINKKAYVVTDTGFSGSTAGLVDIVRTAGPIPAIIGSITTDVEPTDLLITPDNTRVYIANQLSGTLTKYDIATGVTTSIALPSGATPYSLVTNISGNLLFVVDRALDVVYVLSIGTASDTLILVIPVGPTPKGIDVSPDGTIAYVTNSGNDTVSVISMATLSVISTIPGFHDGPESVVFSKDGLTAFVTAYLSDQVYIIDVLSNTIIGNVIVCGNPVGIAVNPQQTYYFISCQQGGTGRVSVMSASSPYLVQTVFVNGAQGTVGAFVG